MNSTKYYYRDRAAYMRSVAQNAPTPQLRTACFRAATGYEALAEKAANDPGQDEGWKWGAPSALLQR